jgi:steroid delta-isomerase-like uncharacterized protein
MTQQDPAAIMRAGFEAIAAKNLDALSATHHEDIVENFIVLGPVEGKQQVREFFTEFFAAVPDLVFEIESVMGVDETIAVGQWKMRGTFNGGPFQGIESTGRIIEIRGIDVMEFEDGLLRYNTIYYDGLSFARQVGLLPAAGSRGDRAMLSAFNAATKTKARLRRG